VDTDPLFTSISDRNNGQGLTTKSIRRVIKSILRRVNLNDKRLSAHSLRHTAISLSIKGGASLEQAQAMARHTDLKTTMIYFHNAARVENGAERFIQF
jgi:integrase/recombinase XerC/integrase/recombinase XerD